MAIQLNQRELESCLPLAPVVYVSQTNKEEGQRKGNNECTCQYRQPQTDWRIAINATVLTQ